MHNQTFLALSCAIPEEEQDLFIGCISDLNFSGIEQSYDTMTILFDEQDCPQDIEELLNLIAANHSISFSIIDRQIIKHQNWNKEWEESLEPIIVSDRIAITPEWKKDEVHHPLTIIINPQMAFGTGYHPTTRMVCRELQERVQPGTSWIDAGCGSGVLAILAAKLGAKSIYAFDNDEWSVQNAKDNCLLNSITHIHIEQADIFTVDLGKVDGIAANMYRNLIIPNLSRFHDALSESKGILILSGILSMDEAEIILAATSKRFKHIVTHQEGDWVSITLIAI